MPPRAYDGPAGLAARGLTFVPPCAQPWRFWRGVVIGFLSGCVLSYALLGNSRQARVHQIDMLPEYVVASA